MKTAKLTNFQFPNSVVSLSPLEGNPLCLAPISGLLHAAQWEKQHHTHTNTCESFNSFPLQKQSFTVRLLFFSVSCQRFGKGKKKTRRRDIEEEGRGEHWRWRWHWLYNSRRKCFSAPFFNIYYLPILRNRHSYCYLSLTLN